MSTLALLAPFALLAAQDPSGAVLARPPSLARLVPAELPPGTSFPAPVVEVVMELDLDARGRVEDARLLSGPGDPFDAAALAAARRLEFEPALLATGEAVPVTITFRMRIEEPPPPPPPPQVPPPVRLSGTLLERGTRRPLRDVPVAARAGGRETARGATGPDGRFALEVPEPEFTLVAAPPGHRRLEEAVRASPGEEREVVYYLERAGTAYEAVVTASPVEREVTRQVIPADVVARVPGSQGDTLRVVLNLPGVARPPYGSGQLLLRGSSPGDSRIFLEGQEIPLIYHFGGLRSTFNARFLEAVDFVPGSFAADYGRATGGVVDVRVRDPASDMVRGEVDLNFYDAGAAVEGPVGSSWSLGGAFHRSWIDTLLPLFLPEDAPISFQTAPRYYDYQLVASRNPSPRERLRLYFFGSMDRVELLFDEPARDPTISGTLRGRVMFHALQASWRSAVSASLLQETSLQLALQQFDTQVGPEYFFRLDVLRLGLRSTWTWQALPWAEARAGLDVGLAGVDIALNVPQPPQEGENPVPPSTRPVVGADKSTTLAEPAVFADVRLTPLPSLAIVPGLRVDYTRAIRSFTVDPRLAARWQLAPGTAVKAGVGLYQQPPLPQESDPDVGTPDLLPERSVHLSLGVEQEIVPGLRAEVTGFTKWLDRLVVRNPAAAYLPSEPAYRNDGEGRIHGVEVLVRAALGGRLSGWLAYTWQRSLRTDRPGEPERPFSFDQPHNLTALATYDLGRGWSVGARFRLVSGNPYTPVTGSVYDAAADVYVPIYGANRSQRLPPFHALDLRADKVWTYDRWRLGLYLDVQNAYNRGNQEGWTYSFDYAERTPATGLPVLPILGLRGEW